MKANVFLRSVLFLAFLLGSGLCHGQLSKMDAGTEPDEYAAPPVSDPLESVNRAIFRFNDGLYRRAIRPIAHGYERVAPAPVRRGLTNFFENLRFPARFVGCVLQAKLGRAGRETEKFLLDTILGLGGFLRPSQHFPKLATVPAEDLGQAFGMWGIKPGPYLVLPFFGPSSVRDALGFVGETYLNPVGWSGARHTIRGYDRTWQYSIEAVDLLNSSPERMRTYDDFKQSAIDPYVSIRDGFLQYRASAVKR